MLTRRILSLGGVGLIRSVRPTRRAGRALEPSGLSYSQAFLVEAPKRILFVSGQVPQDDRGSAPEGFEAQCRLAWANVVRRLSEADMGLANLAKVNIFLAKRDYRTANSAIRHEVLGVHSPAITVVVAEIFDPSWLLEIDAIACG